MMKTSYFSTKNLVFAGVFIALGIVLPFYRPDSPDRKYAASHAYSGIVMRLCLRLAVRADRRVHYPSAAKRIVWNASVIPHGVGYGL